MPSFHARPQPFISCSSSEFCAFFLGISLPFILMPLSQDSQRFFPSFQESPTKPLSCFPPDFFLFSRFLSYVFSSSFMFISLFLAEWAKNYLSDVSSFRRLRIFSSFPLLCSDGPPTLSPSGDLVLQLSCHVATRTHRPHFFPSFRHSLLKITRSPLGHDRHFGAIARFRPQMVSDSRSDTVSIDSPLFFSFFQHGT